MATLLAQTDEKNLIDKLHDLKESYKKKKGFNDEDLQQLKNVLKDIPRLRDVSSTIRVDTLPFFEVIELKQNEMIVKKDNSNVSIYLLVSGKLKKSIHAPWNSQKEEEDRKEQDLITLKENFQEIEGLKAFGNFELLQLDKFDKPQSNKWNPCYVYSLESSVIFYLNFEKTYKYMEKTAEAVHYQDKINFLSKNVPGLINQMNSNRDKIIQLFQPMNFIQNQVIIKEGVMPPMAYIIVSGHCYLQSSQIPLKNNIFAEDPKRAKHFISQNRGYLSKTMNSFQLGIVSEDQWIGEELLAMYLQERYEYINNCLEEDENLPAAKQTWNNQSQSAFKFKPLTLNGFPYSVIAKTNVQAYGITKDDLMFKIGKELQSQINKQAIKKQEWIRKRFAEIQQDVKKLVGQEQSIWNYVDKSKEIGKLYPQANKRTVKTISLKKINEPSIVIEEEPIDIVRKCNIMYQAEQYYNKGMLNTQSISFSNMKKSQSVANILRKQQDQQENNLKQRLLFQKIQIISNQEVYIAINIRRLSCLTY